MRLTAFATELVEFHKSNFASMDLLREPLFGAAQKPFELNAAACHSALEYGAQASCNFFGSMDTQDALALWLTFVPSAMDKLADYSRGLCDLASDANSETLKIAEAQVGCVNRKIAEFSEIADFDSPLGSTAASWMFRGIVNATQSSLQTGLHRAPGRRQTGPARIWRRFARVRHRFAPKLPKPVGVRPKAQGARVAGRGLVASLCRMNSDDLTRRSKRAPSNP